MVTLFYTKIHSEFFIFLGVALHYTIYHLKKFKSGEDFIKELKSYIKDYNTKRIKIKLKGLSPVEYRIKFQLVA